MTLLLALMLCQVVPAPEGAVEVEPAIRGVVERYFQTQEAEDVEGYLALWSAKAERPQPVSLAYIFDSGDDRFSLITVVRAHVGAGTARLRVSALRERTEKRPDGTPRSFNQRMIVALALVLENGEWKIVREGSPVDELALALIQTDDRPTRAALLAEDPSLATIRLVEAIARRADGFAQQQLFEQARRIYERGLEVAVAIKDRRAEGQAVQNLANAFYFLRRFDEAVAMYERRLAIEREADNPEGIANALLGIATVRYTSFDYGTALKLYKEALEIQEKIGDQSLISTTLISTGNIHYIQGEYEAAIADYTRSEELKRRFYDLGGAADALAGLGRVYAAQGDYTSSLSSFNGALQLQRKMALTRLAPTLHSLGEIHFRLGNLDAARSSFEEARRVYQQAKDAGGGGRVLQGIALVELVSARRELAEKAYTDSIAECTSVKDADCVASAQVGLAFALFVQQKYDQSIPWYRKAIASFSQITGRDEAVARARVGLAEALLGHEDFATALKEAIDARQKAIAIAKNDVLWRALTSQARAERRLEQAGAIGTARAAVATVRQMAAAHLDRPNLPVPRDTSGAYAAAIVLLAESGDAAAAFELAEEMRAHSLRLWLAPHEREIARGMTDEERAVEKQLTADLMALLARRDREAELPKPDLKRVEKLDAEITTAIGRRTAAREQLFARLPELRRLRGLAAAPRIDSLETLLDDPAKALLAFVVDEHHVVTFTARREAADKPAVVAATVVFVDRQTLGDRALRAMEATPLSDQSAWRSASRELFHIVPRPAQAVLESAGSITIIPDDLLWRVPFEAFPTETGFLSDRAVVSYLPSLASTSAEVRRATAPPAPLIVSAPRLPAALVDGLKITAPTWVIRADEQGLAEAAALTAALKEPAPAVVSGEAATVKAVGAALGTAASAHIGAPFRVNAASPLFSAVLLAAEPTPVVVETPAPDKPAVASPERDAGVRPAVVPDAETRLEVRDLFGLPAAPQVVSIGDPAALSMRDSAAAVPPVHWAWSAAGTNAMLIRRWGGVDESSAALISKFHEELRGGKTPAAALHAARAAVRAATDRRAPGAWANWMLVSAR